MSHVETSRYIWYRLSILLLLLCCSILFYAILSTVAPPTFGPVFPFLPVWAACFLPYFAACLYILKTKPLAGRGHWAEIAIVLLGAFIMRLLLLPLPDGLSPDVWRYLWDAHITVHGYSPYIYAPVHPMLEPLRNVLFVNSRFRNLPTNYPPGAQGIFIVGYLLSPMSLIGLKSLLIVFDMITCGALTWLLYRKGLNMRHVIMYAWSPLPVVEFAIEGHVDVVLITFIVLAVLCASFPDRRMQFATGFFIGMATLTKLYPLLLLAMFLHWYNWRIFVGCFATLLSGYIPFIILGHGQVLGFFLSFVEQQGVNEGIIQLLLWMLGNGLGLGLAAIVMMQKIVDALFIGSVAIVMAILRNRNRISMEAATLILVGVALAISPFVFPWYATILLPWVTLLVSPLPVKKRVRGKEIAIASIWYFTFAVLWSYYPGIDAYNTTPNWLIYYGIAYLTVLLGLGIAVGVAIRYKHVATSSPVS